MNKILLIIQREYLSRVRKKSFIIMTFLGPILMAGIWIIPIYLAMKKPDKQKLEVIDESFLFKGLIPEKKDIHFDYPEISLDVAQDQFYNTDYDAILYIPHNILEGKGSAKIFYKNQLGNATKEYVRSTLNKMLYDIILAKNKVNLDVIRAAETGSRFDLLVEELQESGKSKKMNTGLNYGIGFGSGLLIYMFIFLYGVQVMRGVMEEKTNRIVEVILSSVKPFQLMMGKIIGIAMVGLTQFLLWVVLTSSIYSVAGSTILKNTEVEQVQKKEEVLKVGADIDYKKMGKIEDTSATFKLMSDFKNIDIGAILVCFVFYFLGGYLMYSALFAAIGSAIDSESDTQQFMLPITIPLIFSFVVAQYVIQYPNSATAIWLSFVPFTSPVIMMVWLPFGVPAWQVIVSMCLLILGFIFTTWIAGRIYRTGILMYGKKSQLARAWKMVVLQRVIHFKQQQLILSEIKKFMNRIAIIDLGTNTFNLLIVQINPDKNYDIICQTKISVKLGEGGITKGYIAPEAFQRGIDALKMHRLTIELHNAEKVIAFATSAIREASNGTEFIRQAKEKTKIDVEMISGDREAELIYLGVRDAVQLTDKASLIIDIGGGSTEFIIANKDKIFWKYSFLLGAARLLEKFKPSDPMTEEESREITSYLKTELEPLYEAIATYPVAELVGSSGSFDSLAEMIAYRFYTPEILKDKTEYQFSLPDCAEIYKILLKSTKKERMEMKRLISMRVDMIVVSSILVHFILVEFDIHKMRLSTYSLKEGVLHELIQ